MAPGRTIAPTHALLAAAALASVALATSPAGAGEIGDGELDPIFDGGTVSVIWEYPGAATAAAAVAGGKLLVAGTVDYPAARRWAIAELTESGQLAAPWTQQFVPFDFDDEAGSYEARTVYDVGRDAQGRTIVLGAIESSFGDRPAMARLLTTGGLDSAFSSNGLRVLLRPTSWESVSPEGGIVLPSGGAIVTGYCTGCRTGDGDSTSAFLLKLLSSGSPDTSFSTDGWYAFGMNALDSIQGKAVEIDATGRLLVAFSGSGGEDSFIGVARVLANGGLDPAFGGGDGFSALVDRAYGIPTGVAIDPESGRILVSRSHSGGFSEGSVVAFTAAGALDQAFGVDGTRFIPGDGLISDLAIRSDGKIVTAGIYNTTDYLAARLTRSGAPDPLFEGTGWTHFSIVAGQEFCYDVTEWGGRQVLVGEGFESGHGHTFGVARLHSRLIFQDGFERGSTGGWGKY